MSLPRKIRYIEKRTIDGVGYDIHTISNMEYNGQWIDAGFDVICDGKFIASFIGWPTDSDIKNHLTNQNSTVN